MAMGKSRSNVCLVIIRPCSLTKADTPIIIEIFNIFAPKIFPKEIFGSSLMIAINAVTSSGIEVPIASKVRLITCFGIPKHLQFLPRYLPIYELHKQSKSTYSKFDSICKNIFLYKAFY